VRRQILEILVDPISKTPLRLEENHLENGEIIEGVLHGEAEHSYLVTNGIPRFVHSDDADQLQTEFSFAFKWQQRNTYDSAQFRKTSREWLVRRYGFRTPEDMRSYFASRRRILDAGCGGGFSSSLCIEGLGGEWVGVDVSVAVDIARERLQHIAGTHFVQADLIRLPFLDNTFDTIFSEGVLHHTPLTEQSLKSLGRQLQRGGEFLFYVYRKKAPIREFTDDYVRGIVSCLDPEEAWAMLRPLTRLGKALAEVHVEVEVPEDIPYLGIKAGRYDVQRLIYWHFAKLFWNEAFSFEENNHVNFDWYHPRYAHRHTEDEVRRWCDEAGLRIIHFNIQESGFTVRAIKEG